MSVRSMGGGHVGHPPACGRSVPLGPLPLHSGGELPVTYRAKQLSDEQILLDRWKLGDYSLVSPSARCSSSVELRAVAEALGAMLTALADEGS